MARKKYIKNAPSVCVCRKRQTGGVYALHLRWKDASGKICVEYCHDDSGHVLHLVDKDAPFAEDINKEAMTKARALAAAKVIALINGEGEQAIKNRSKILAVDWITNVMDNKIKDGLRISGNYKAIKTIIQSFTPNVRLSQIDKDYIIKLQRYIRDSHKNSITLEQKPLNINTIVSYLRALSTCLNVAERKGYIRKNPFTELETTETIKPKQANRGFLSVDEIKRLIDTECNNNEVKKAFLFACFCGLRYSDLKRIRYENLVKTPSGVYLDITFKKTGKSDYIPVSDEALNYIDKDRQEGVIFDLPRSATGCNHFIKLWAKQANISKNVSMHISRHTFATLMILQDANIYAVQKIMGHSDVKITQIYADMINESKMKAVSLLNGIIKRDNE